MRGPNRGRFSCPKRPHGFCPRDKGGVGTRSGREMGHYCIPLSISFRWIYPLVIGPSPCRTAEIWEDDSDPPQKRGGMRSRVAALWDRPLHRPRGSLSSVFIPAGRLGVAPQKGVLTERVRCPFPLVLHDSRSVLAVKGTLRRFAPWTAAGRSEGDGCLRGRGGGWPGWRVASGRVGGPKGNLSVIPAA